MCEHKVYLFMFDHWYMIFTELRVRSVCSCSCADFDARYKGNQSELQRGHIPAAPSSKDFARPLSRSKSKSIESFLTI